MLYGSRHLTIESYEPLPNIKRFKQKNEALCFAIKKNKKQADSHATKKRKQGDSFFYSKKQADSRFHSTIQPLYRFARLGWTKHMTAPLLLALLPPDLHIRLFQVLLLLLS